MEKIFIYAVIFVFIMLLAMFFLVSQMSVGMGRNIRELGLELEKTQQPLSTPLGISNAILRIIVSFLSLFTPSS